MVTATTITTTAVVITTAAIVARNQPRSLLIRNTAKNANAWTLRISLVRSTPNVTKAKINVVRRTTKAMATATTKTTTVVASTTAAIVARNQPRSLLIRNTAKSASAWTLRISRPKKTTKKTTNPNVTQAKINVVRRNTKAMATATTKTTTVVASTTVAIVARKEGRL